MGAREDKYREKISGEVRKRLYDEQKAQMVANMTQPTKDLVDIELKVKEIVQGEPILYHHFYMAFGKECYSKTLSHADLILSDELIILEEKWRMRGLDDALLEKIKEIFIKFLRFRLNISFLDGNHRLS